MPAPAKRCAVRSRSSAERRATQNSPSSARPSSRPGRRTSRGPCPRARRSAPRRARRAAPEPTAGVGWSSPASSSAERGLGELRVDRRRQMLDVGDLDHHRLGRRLDPDRQRRRAGARSGGRRSACSCAVLGAVQQLLAEVVVDGGVGAAPGRAGERDGRGDARRCGARAAPGWRRRTRPPACRRRSRSRSRTTSRSAPNSAAGECGRAAVTATSRARTSLSSSPARIRSTARRPRPRRRRRAHRGDRGRRRRGGSSGGSGASRSDASRRREPRASAAGSSPGPTIAQSVSRCRPPDAGEERARASSAAPAAATTTAPSREPSGEKAMPPTQSGPAPCGRSSGSSARRSRVIRGRVGAQVGDAAGPARDDLVGAAERADREAVAIRLLPAEPAVVGAARGEGGRAGIDRVDLDGHADQPPRPSAGAARSARRSSESSADGLDRRRSSGQLSGRARAIATSPVRAISISPCGRTMRSKESIFSVGPGHLDRDRAPRDVDDAGRGRSG